MLTKIKTSFPIHRSSPQFRFAKIVLALFPRGWRSFWVTALVCWGGQPLHISPINQPQSSWKSNWKPGQKSEPHVNVWLTLLNGGWTCSIFRSMACNHGHNVSPGPPGWLSIAIISPSGDKLKICLYHEQHPPMRRKKRGSASHHIRKLLRAVWRKS